MTSNKELWGIISGIIGVLVVILLLWYFKSRKNNTPPLPSDIKHACISIPNSGGFDRLCLTDCKYACLGANIPNAKPGIWNEIPPFLSKQETKNNYALIEVHSIGINYADCCIRWGLYESAKQYVGWPITPGFEFSGRIIELYGNKEQQQFKKNDLVFGVTLFGAYSTHVLVPCEQIFLKPTKMSMEDAGGFLCTAMTAYYALFELCDSTIIPHIQQHIQQYTLNYYNSNQLKLNQQIELLKKPLKCVLIHSASGGVGSMLIQMCKKIAKYDIVVGIVGGKHKISLAKNLGCDYVIDRKATDNIWNSMKQIIPNFDGFDIIFDANGVSTLKDGYKHLKPTGRLIVYGFHSMLPQSGSISPLQWIQLGINAIKTPSFSAMGLSQDNKLVAGFNLSFLFSRMDLLQIAMANLLPWIEQDLVKVAQVTKYKMNEVGQAHHEIQSGTTVGKLVLITPNAEKMKY